jgi:hypothetical protein
VSIAGLPRGEIGGAGPDSFAVFGKLSGQNEFRRIARQASDANFLDDPFRKRLAEMPEERSPSLTSGVCERERNHRAAAQQPLRILRRRTSNCDARRGFNRPTKSAAVI